MIQFDMKRFLSVGRWDVTVNRRFYTNQATALLVLAVAPVVVRFLSAWEAKHVANAKYKKADKAGDETAEMLPRSILRWIWAIGYGL